jgi:hypothetical protein
MQNWHDWLAVWKHYFNSELTEITRLAEKITKLNSTAIITTKTNITIH